MKFKWLIGAIIVVGIAAVGVSYVIANNNDATKANIKQQPVVASQNEKQPPQNISSNQNMNNSSKNNNLTNINNVPQKPNPPSNPNLNNGEVKSTGNFDQIINGSGYMVGDLNGASIIVPLKGGTINSDKQLVLPAYSTNNLNEVFQLKISSIGNGNYDAYEFLNGTNLGVFKLKANMGNGDSNLSGTFSKLNSNNVEGIRFRVVNTQNEWGPLTQYPFYHCIIAGTQVNIAVTSKSNNFIERYQGDSNIFNLKIDYALNTNDLALTESYNGVKTGEYLLNMQNSNPDNGTFTTKPGQVDAKTYNVSLYGSYNPN
ncbi:MAG: hypothetical protein ACRC41_11200 [Sarcina sp.]